MTLLLRDVMLVVRACDEATAFDVAVLGFELTEDRPLADTGWARSRAGPAGTGAGLGRATTAEQAASTRPQAGGRALLRTDTNEQARDGAAFEARLGSDLTEPAP